MLKREHKEAKNQNVAIQAQPQFVSIFRKSEAVLTIKGNDIFMRPLSLQILLKGRNILRK